MSYRSTLADEEKETLAHELALGYYTNDELRHVFKLHPSAMTLYLESEGFAARVAQAKRKIDESDQALRIHARKAARVAIDELAALVKDKDAPAKTRMEAGRQLREYAFGADRNVLPAAAAGEGAIYIESNLDFGEQKGVYSLTAKEIAEQEEPSGMDRLLYGD